MQLLHHTPKGLWVKFLLVSCIPRVEPKLLDPMSLLQTFQAISRLFSNPLTTKWISLLKSFTLKVWVGGSVNSESFEFSFCTLFITDHIISLHFFPKHNMCSWRLLEHFRKKATSKGVPSPLNVIRLEIIDLYRAWDPGTVGVWGAWDRLGFRAQGKGSGGILRRR